jgi:sec-independent protein translocase protein TatA
MFRNPTTDLIVILVVVLLIFGPKRLPLLGRQLGQGMREFKDGITGKSKNAEGSERPELAQASTDSAPAPAPAPASASPEPQPVEAPAPVATSPERGTGEAAAPDPRA